MKRYPNDKIVNSYAGIVLILPIIVLYFWVFISSMEVALDRADYLDIMSYPFKGREEPLLHLISFILEPIFFDPTWKLIFIQLFFIILLFITIFKKYKTYNTSGFLKTIIIVFLFLSIFSNMLGVQLRIGYATIIFLFIVFFLNKKPNLINLPIYLIPCLMHSGLFFAVISFYAFWCLKIDSKYKFAVFVVLSIIVSTVFIKSLPFIFEVLGVSDYYFIYLSKTASFGRKLPFSVLFFLLFSFLSIVFFGRKYCRDIYFWYGIFGLLLVYVGLFLNFYVAFKMLVPFSAFLYLYIVDKFRFEYTNSILLLILLLILMPFSYLMLMNQVGLV